MHCFIDLFCRIGGFRVALEEKGLECVYSCDIDKDTQDAYYKNFGERPEGDITEISERRIPKHDILCAGFPCQPFSISGKRNGMTMQNGRLFYEIIRIAQYHRPIVLLLENVKNLLSMENGSVVKIAIQRKGGNDVRIHEIKDKGEPTHPDNNIQFKLKINNFVKEMENIKLGQYVI